MPLFTSSRRYTAFLLTAFVVLSGEAWAGTSTGNFKVTLTIQSECKLNSTTDIAFGTSGVIQAALTATGTLGVQCTNTTPYNIGLSAGAGAGATVTSRIMTSGTGSTIGYSLYRDAAFAQAWGSTVASNTMAATGNGAVQTYTVYGRVPPQTTPAAGNYSDTVQVTVTY
jgi:spore coat protein U-like protein